MPLVDPETVKGLALIVLIVWLSSAGGISFIRMLVDELLSGL